MFDKFAIFLAVLLLCGIQLASWIWPNAWPTEWSVEKNYVETEQVCLVDRFYLGVQQVLIDKRDGTVTKTLTRCKLEE